MVARQKGIQPMPNGHQPITLDFLRSQTREIIEHFEASQRKQDEWIHEEFTSVNTKLDAIMSGEVLVTRKQLQRLLRELSARGITLNEKKILAS